LEEEDADMEEEELPLDAARFVGNNVIKLFVTSCSASYVRPWSTRSQSFGTGTAFPIGERRLLTNAHVVKDATVVRVQRCGEFRKYAARVERFSQSQDLALLTVDSDDFWVDLEEVKFNDSLPALQEEVAVVGYPGDSDNICITQGVVSRVDMSFYTNDVQLLVLQIDAAINAGNSGGPVLDESGRCVGVAFEKMTSEEIDNVGYVIPTEVVRSFLDDKGGVGYAGFQYQPFESSAARASLGLPAGEKRGVRVRYVDASAPSHATLHVDDVILRIDGVDIGYDGTVPLAAGRSGERVHLSYLMSRRHPKDVCKFEAWRDGKGLSLDLTLGTSCPLVPCSPGPAEYLLVGGLVFVPLTEPYLEGQYGKDFYRDAPSLMVYMVEEGRRSSIDEQVLVLGHALCADGDFDDAAEEVQGTVHSILKSFNGVPVRNLRELAAALAGAGRWLRFEFRHGEVIVLDSEAAEKHRRQVMEVHRIQHPMCLRKDDVAA